MKIIHPISPSRFFSKEFQKLPLDERRNILEIEKIKLLKGRDKKKEIEKHKKLVEERLERKKRLIYIKRRNNMICRMRLKGKTLEEIGCKTNLTRERVRQILFIKQINVWKKKK